MGKAAKTSSSSGSSSSGSSSSASAAPPITQAQKKANTALSNASNKSKKVQAKVLIQMRLEDSPGVIIYEKGKVAIVSAGKATTKKRKATSDGVSESDDESSADEAVIGNKIILVVSQPLRILRRLKFPMLRQTK
jgi:hypothetical protein